MDYHYHGRRGRRGRCHSSHSQSTVSHSFSPPSRNNQKPWSYLSGVYSFFIMSCLIALIYMIMEYHCNTCSTKCNLGNLTRSIDDISKNLATMKDNYFELEDKISMFTRELPKLEGQLEVLEALANTIDYGPFGWDPKSHLCLPNVDVFLMNCAGDNFRRNTTKQCSSVNQCPKSIELKQAF